MENQFSHLCSCWKLLFALVLVLQTTFCTCVRLENQFSHLCNCCKTTFYTCVGVANHFPHLCWCCKTTLHTWASNAKPVFTLVPVENHFHTRISVAEPLSTLVLVLKSTFRTSVRVAKPLSPLVPVMQNHFPNRLAMQNHFPHLCWCGKPLSALVFMLKTTFHTSVVVAKPLSTLVKAMQNH